MQAVRKAPTGDRGDGMAIFKQDGTPTRSSKGASPLGRIMELSTAATSAANTASTILEAFTKGGEGQQSRFGEGAQVLRPPDAFNTKDPIKYSLWREQILNWLTFCDSRYAELIQDVERLETMTTMGFFGRGCERPCQEVVFHFVFIPARSSPPDCQSILI